MRILITITIIAASWGVIHGQTISDKHDPKKHPTLVNKTFVDKINGKPIEFYLRHKNIDLPAKMFYKGEYALYDDDETFAFFDSLLTRNAETRPFYLFIFNQAVKVSDGGLSEYIASICRRYLETYPCEFLVNLNESTASQAVDKWIAYTGFDLYDRKTFDQVVADVGKQINTSCPGQKSVWTTTKLRIEDALEEK